MNSCGRMNKTSHSLNYSERHSQLHRNDHDAVLAEGKSSAYSPLLSGAGLRDGMILAGSHVTDNYGLLAISFPRRCIGSGAYASRRSAYHRLYVGSLSKYI